MNKVIICILTMSISCQAIAIDCSGREKNFQSSMEKMYDCTEDKMKKVFDMTTQPRDIAISVSYQCYLYVKKLSESQYDVMACQAANDEGVSISVIEKKNNRAIWVSKSSDEINEILLNKYISDTVRYRAKIIELNKNR
ncbi:hypothetical protein PEC302107_36100 [Pectobacterium araliae]|nr:hypothetical protein PEC302107_36100 [Pectobacterium carotovorum subsp. carotovorum]